MSKPNPAGRPASDQRMSGDARKLWSEMIRNEAKAEQATAVAASAREELEAMRAKQEAKLHKTVLADALLLDVLDLIEVVDGDRWYWRGVRNNHDLATVRVGRQELSLVRYLAIQFGVIAEDAYGSLYPTDGDTEDVNPWHRVLRHADAPMGNRRRYTFGPVDE